MANHLNAAGPYRAYLAGLAVLILSACSPRYDWRELHSTQPAWVALFPDKAQTQTRAMNLNGWPLDMTMTVTRVNEISFVLGHATVTGENAGKNAGQDAEAQPRPALKEVLRDAMLRNIQGTKQSEQAVLIARVGPNQMPLPALAVEADGQVGGKAVHLSARFASYDADSKAIQMMVLGPQEVMSRPAGQQAAETFLTSLQVE